MRLNNIQMFVTMLFLSVGSCKAAVINGQFPANFTFGVTTSAFAHEGAWDDYG